MEFFTLLSGNTNFSLLEKQETFTKSFKKVTLKITIL